MYTKWTRKEAARFFICFAVFFALVLLTQLPGFLSPLYWALFPILSAFVAAGPLTCVMDMKRGFGSTAVIPLLWLIVYKCIGEFSISLMWIWIVALLVIGEIVRRAIGYERPAGIRVCVCVLIFNAVVKLWKSAVKDIAAGIIFGVILILSLLTKLSPVWYVIAAALAGIAIQTIKVKKGAKA